jgi:ribosomal protein L37AE/L43A
MQSHQEAQTATLEIIEQSGRDQPFCPSCGRPNHAVARDGVIWIECQAWGDQTSLLARIILATAGHTRHQLVDEPPSVPILETS